MKGGIMFTQKEKEYLLESVKSDINLFADMVVSEPDKWKDKLSFAKEIRRKLEEQ